MARPIKALLISPFISQKIGMLMADVNKESLTTLAELMQSGKVKPVSSDLSAKSDRRSHAGPQRKVTPEEK